MKTRRTRFEAAIQAVTEDTKSWLRDEFKSILESEKEFTHKTDYIGMSINHLDSQIQSVDQEIKELKALLQQLKAAKSTALEVGAEVLQAYGIDKIEGTVISSLTVAPAKEKVFRKLEILDEDELIKAGYYIKVVDEDALLEADQYKHRRELIEGCYRVIEVDASTPAKLKVNKRRSVNNTNTTIEEIAS